MQYLEEVKACDQGNADACARAVNLEGLSANRNEALKAACADSASAACKVEMDKAYAALQTQINGEAEYWSWLAQNPLKLSKGEENSDVEALVTHTTLADLIWKIDCAKAGSDCSTRGSSQLLWQGDPVTAARHEAMRTLLESAGKVGGVGGRAIDTVTGLYDLLKEASPVTQMGKTWTAIEYVNEHGLQAYLDTEQAKSKAMWSGLYDSAKGYAGDIGSVIKNNLQGGPQWDIYDVIMQGNTEGKVGFDVLSSLVGGTEINALAKGLLGSRGARAATEAAEAAARSRVFNGVELHPDLPPPAAGYDYVPGELADARTPNQANSHINGYTSEVNLANEIASSGQTVIKWGDKIGRQGSDVISVDPVTGEVTLWDSKYRSASGTPIPESPTFANDGTRIAAVREAQREIRSSSLPADIQKKALDNLEEGNYSANTVGSGGAKNSVIARYCSGVPCTE